MNLSIINSTDLLTNAQVFNTHVRYFSIEFYCTSFFSNLLLCIRTRLLNKLYFCHCFHLQNKEPNHLESIIKIFITLELHKTL